MSQKLNGGGREWVSQVADLSFKNCSLGPKQPFLGQKSPRTHSKRPNKGKRWVHSTCGLTFLCQRAVCGPLTPPYVLETAQEGPQKPQILCRLAGDGHKPRTGHIFGYMIWLKNDPTPCVMLKQVFLDRFELVVAYFGPPKIPKCLENGLFWDQKWVKNVSKTHFSKTHPRPVGVHQRVK